MRGSVMGVSSGLRIAGINQYHPIRMMILFDTLPAVSKGLIDTV